MVEDLVRRHIGQGKTALPQRRFQPGSLWLRLRRVQFPEARDQKVSLRCEAGAVQFQIHASLIKFPVIVPTGDQISAGDVPEIHMKRAKTGGAARNHPTIRAEVEDGRYWLVEVYRELGKAVQVGEVVDAYNINIMP